MFLQCIKFDFYRKMCKSCGMLNHLASAVLILLLDFVVLTTTPRGPMNAVNISDYTWHKSRGRDRGNNGDNIRATQMPEANGEKGVPHVLNPMTEARDCTLRTMTLILQIDSSYLTPISILRLRLVLTCREMNKTSRVRRIVRKI